LWSLEDPNKAFVPVELKPDNLDEPTEVITKSVFHPSADNLFAYATSRGTLKLADMRTSGTQLTNLAICDSTAINFTHEVNTPKNFFTEFISCYSGVSFMNNQRYIAARDF
jgi:serine/threonine-protein phosphatase 2A regulatory subunit B